MVKYGNLKSNSKIKFIRSLLKKSRLKVWYDLEQFQISKVGIITIMLQNFFRIFVYMFTSK